MPSTTLTYPTSAELQVIAQDKIANLIQDRPIFQILPIADVDANILRWEQMDNYQGLQQVRGIGGAPGRVSKTGAKGYLMEPGIYGEFEELDEKELTERRQYGTFGNPINVSDLVMQTQDKLLGRRLDRIEYIGWTLLTTGTFSVADGQGIVKHTDTFPIQTYTAATSWSVPLTSGPLADFRAVMLKARGHSVDFGPKAIARMNRVTWNDMISNTNPADLYGRRTTGLGTFENLDDVNKLLTKDGLPTIEIYDAGYISDGFDGNAAGTFVPFIPNNKVVLVGVRPVGQVVGNYRMTRNVQNPDMGPGPYMRVIDTREYRVPGSIEVHDGHNGGPVIFYPSAVVYMSV